jgi:hypothetical protein
MYKADPFKQTGAGKPSFDCGNDTLRFVQALEGLNNEGVLL